MKKIFNSIKNHKKAIIIGTVGVGVVGGAATAVYFIKNKNNATEEVADNVADTVETAVDNIDAACASINFDTFEF